MAVSIGRYYTEFKENIRRCRNPSFETGVGNESNVKSKLHWSHARWPPINSHLD